MMSPTRKSPAAEPQEAPQAAHSEEEVPAETSYLGTVVCVSQHVIDLHDGRPLAPGETAEGVDLNDPHSRALVLDGHVIVTEGKVPRVPVTSDQEESLKSRAARRRQVARDAATGRFIDPAAALANPGSTVTEEV
jgi:hypothetical protein